MRIYLFSLILVTLIVLPVSGQEKMLTVRTMSMSSSDLPDIFIPGTKGFEEIEFSSIQPSSSSRVIARNPLPIFFSLPEVKENIKPDALVKLPTGSKGILLLGWESGGAYKFVALPDDMTDGAGPDRWLLVNATTEDLAFQLGANTKPTVIKPGTSKTHKVSVKLGEGAAATAARIIDEKPVIIFSTYWEVYEEQRCVIIFAPDGKHIRVRQIADFASAVKNDGE